MHFRVHKYPPLVHILIQLNKVQALDSYFFQINFNIIFLSVSRSSKMTVYFGVSTKNLYTYFCLHSKLYLFSPPPPPPIPQHIVLDLASCKDSVDCSDSSEHSILWSGFSEQNIQFSGSIKGEEFLNEARQVSASTNHSVLWSYLCHNSTCTVYNVLS